MDGPRAVTASFGLPMGQLNVFASGTGIVNAFLQDSKIIDCSGESSGPDCSEVVPLGTTIELIVSTPVNMAVSWGGACSGQELSCQVSITEVTDVYVTFTPIQYTLTVIISGASNPGPGRGSILLSTPPEAECVYANDGPPLVTCPFTYDPGTVVTLTAVPYAPLDSFFDKWGGACDGVAAAAPCTLTINGDTTVTGAFGYVIQ
jgi:hypothetical protein